MACDDNTLYISYSWVCLQVLSTMEKEEAWNAKKMGKSGWPFDRQPIKYC